MSPQTMGKCNGSFTGCAGDDYLRCVIKVRFAQKVLCKKRSHKQSSENEHGVVIFAYSVSNAVKGAIRHGVFVAVCSDVDESTAGRLCLHNVFVANREETEIPSTHRNIWVC